MKTDNKTHYRKVFKSDHLGSADLEEMLEEKKRLVFTIEKVTQEYATKVAGKKIDANIAYFKGGVKPLVLNATNSKIMAKLTGSKFVEDWKGLTIELYINANVRFGSDTVSGVRIKDKLPVLAKHELEPSSPFWAKAKKAALAGETDFDSLNKNYSISEENFEIMIDPKQE